MNTHPNFALRTAKLSLISAAFFSSVSALAQSPTVVVSATRFAEPIDALPIGIRVISASDIENSGATSVADLLAKSAGVYTRNSAGDGNVQIDLRGFGATGDQNSLVLIDGQRLSEHEQTSARLSSMPLAAVERIEILAGGGAVQFGSGATGGVINVITKTSGVKSGLHGRVALSGGSFDTRTGSASVDFGGELFGINLAASDSKTDNYRHNNAVDEQNVSGKATLQIGAGEIWASFASGKTDAGLPGPLSNLQIAANPRQTTNPLDKMTAKNSTLGAGGRMTFGQAEFALDVSTRDRDFDSLAPSFAGGATNATRVNTDSINPRLRVTYSLFDRPAVLVVGGQIADWDYQRNLNLPLFFFGSNIVASQQDQAVFVQNRVALMPTTHLLTGVRWQSTDIDMQERSFPSPVQRQTNKVNAFEIGLRHAFSNEWASSVRWGQSFRMANVDDNGFTASGALLKPQTSHDTEIAAEFKTSAAQVRAAAFESRVTNEIHFLATPSFGFFNGANDNLPPTRHRGVETELRLPLSKELEVNANYRYTQARYRSGVFSGFNVAGKDIPLVPTHRASLGLSRTGASGLSINASARFVGEQRFDNDQVNVNPKMDSYTVADLRVAQRFGAWTLALSVDNVFDKNYISYGLIAAPGASGYNAYPEAGRRVTASAQWAF